MINEWSSMNKYLKMYPLWVTETVYFMLYTFFNKEKKVFSFLKKNFTADIVTAVAFKLLVWGNIYPL